MRPNRPAECKAAPVSMVSRPFLCHPSLANPSRNAKRKKQDTGKGRVQRATESILVQLQVPEVILETGMIWGRPQWAQQHMAKMQPRKAPSSALVSKHVERLFKNSL